MPVSTVRAVLFDVGGPIDTEVEGEAMIDARIRDALGREGGPVTDAEYAAANARAVESFAPNAYAAITWYLARHRPESAARLATLSFLARPLELRPGIGVVLRDVHARGILLGLAANQSTRVLTELDRHGIGHFFRTAR